MGRKRTPGLYKRKDTWHIDKKVLGSRICESTGTSDLEEAEKYLAKRIEDLRQTVIYGVRPKRTFRQAATKYLLENKNKRSIAIDAMHLKQLDSFIGDLYLEQIHIGTLQPFIAARKKAGRKTNTINLALDVVRHILNLAAGEWMDENGITWLHSAPKIKLLPVEDARSPYPLSWEEQDKLFSQLPKHLRQMALFKCNVGCREKEVCNLQWGWERKIPELNTSVFIIPKEFVKNKHERLVVLNKIAQQVIDEVRGQHKKYVFTYAGRKLKRMNGTAWQRARKKVELKQTRVHDLKHTFGRRLRAAGINFEDRQDLLGHKSTRGITTHYSSVEIKNLIEAANKVCDSRNSNSMTLELLKKTLQTCPANIPQESVAKTGSST